MSAIEIYLMGLAAALGLLTTLWLVSLVLRNSSIVDIFWGAGFAVLGWSYFLLAPQGFPPKSLERRPGYREYIESTSGFVPWFPRKAKGKAS